MPATCYFDTFAAADIERTLKRWAQAHPEHAVMAFVAEADRAAIPALQKACRDAGLPLVGALFPELVYGDRLRRRGVLLFHLDALPAHALVEDLSAGDPETSPALEAMLAVAEPVSGTAPRGTLMLLFDALVPNIESWLAALYRRLGRSVHYLGANAGSETFQPIPCLFDAERVATDAVLVLALPTLPGGVLQHGYPPPRQLITATATQGNRIITIDWRPALDVYRGLARKRYGVTITRENVYAYGVHFPFGIIRASGDVLVRIPVAMDEEGALVCIGEVPENAILTLLSAETVSSEATVKRLLDELGSTGVDARLAFYCAGRRLHDADQARQELQRLAAQSPVPLAGALSLGEIGSSTRDGYPLFHNATLVCADWKGP